MSTRPAPEDRRPVRVTVELPACDVHRLADQADRVPSWAASALGIHKGTLDALVDAAREAAARAAQED